MHLYLAGPLFTTSELEFNRHLAHLLRNMMYDCYLPQESECNFNHIQDAGRIFSEDVLGIDGSDVVVANMDGSDPDSGTSWEVGYAYAKCKQIILYRTDHRKEAGTLGPYNLMMHQSTTRERVLDCSGLETVGVAFMLDTALRKLEKING